MIKGKMMKNKTYLFIGIAIAVMALLMIIMFVFDGVNDTKNNNINQTNISSIIVNENNNTTSRDEKGTFIPPKMENNPFSMPSVKPQTNDENKSDESEILMSNSANLVEFLNKIKPEILFNPKELNSSRANYGKVNLCELLLTDFIFNPYESSNTNHTAQSPSVSTTEEIKFKNAKTSSESLDPFTGKFASSDTVTLYRSEDSGYNENKSEANGKEDKNSSNDKTKPKNPYFTSIRMDEEEIEYKLKEGMIEMSCFKQSGNPGSNDSNLVSNQTSSHSPNYLNFTLLNFAYEVGKEKRR